MQKKPKDYSLTLKSQIYKIKRFLSIFFFFFLKQSHHTRWYFASIIPNDIIQMQSATIWEPIIITLSIAVYWVIQKKYTDLHEMLLCNSYSCITPQLGHSLFSNRNSNLKKKDNIKDDY